MPSASLHPSIGVISDCALQRHMIQKALSNYGLAISVSCDPALLSGQVSEKVQQVTCWVLVLENEDFESDEINDLIEQTEIPVLFGLGQAPAQHGELYISWERRLISKLEELIGKVNIFESETSVLSLTEERPQSNQGQSVTSHTVESDPNSVFISQQKKHSVPASSREKHLASEIWVLASSLGGPGAVKSFLDLIPETIKASFLYAQHIDAHFSHILTQVLGRHAKVDLLALESGYALYDGEVRVVPVDHEVTFHSGAGHVQQNPWQGPYGPSIDHLLKNLVAEYGSRCHVIVFSGMGNDSAMMAKTMKEKGCQIWTQRPDTCASASMPQSIIDLNCSNLTATPEELAHALIKRVGCHETETPALQ